MVEIKIKVGGKKKTGILSMLTQFIFGIFIISVIFASFVKLWQETGILFGFATTILLTFLSFYKSSPKSFLRRMSWGMATTIVLIVLGYFGIMYAIESSYQGFNSN